MMTLFAVHQRTSQALRQHVSSGIVLAAILGLSSQAAAQELFRVEVLLFENLAASRYTVDAVEGSAVPEYPQSARVLFDERPAAQLTQEDDIGAALSDPSESQTPPSAARTTLPLVPDSDLRLASMKQRLQRSADYRPLLLTGWVEDIPSEYRGQPAVIKLAYNEAGLPAYEGSILIQRRRFLHVSAEIYHSHFSIPDNAIAEVAEPATSTLGTETPPNTALAMLQDNDAMMSPVPAMVRDSMTVLKEKRRIRSGEVHYFDSPEFGLVVYVEPVGSDVSEEPIEGEANDTPDLSIPPTPTEPESDSVPED